MKEAILNHEQRLTALLNRCEDKQIKLSKDNFKLRETETKYIGHVLTPEGLKPDPSNVEAILQMKSPQDLEGVRIVLGVVNYLAMFMPHLSDVCEPLKQLAPPDVNWEWADQQEQSFRHISYAITQAPVLK